MSTAGSALEAEAAKDVQKGRYSKAVSKYGKLLETVPEKRVQWLCDRGECYLKLGEAQKALEDGKEANRLEEASIEACVLCGRACSLQDMFTDSFKYYKAGLALDPNNKVITEDLKKLQNLILKDQEKKSTGADWTYSAVNLCSQAIYPGDDQLLNMEKEILEVKYKILDDVAYITRIDNSPKKNTELEAQLVQAAYECMMAERLEESLALVSKAVTADPTNIFYRTFRAQVYFNMKQWSKVIQDYWVIPKPQRKADVWKQGGQALMELWLPVLAEFWFRKATQLSDAKDGEAAVLFQKVRVRRLYEPLTEDLPVKVDFTQFGRVVIAKRDIPQGGQVMTDIPMVMAQTLTTMDNIACCNCATAFITPEIYFKDKMKAMSKEQLSLIDEYWPKVNEVLCPYCGKEKYCSNLCKNEAWDVYHRILCPHYNPEASQLYAVCEQDGYGYTSDGRWEQLWTGHYSPMILAKIWAIIAGQVRNMIEEDGSSAPTIEHWARAKAPFRRFIAFGTTTATTHMPYMLPIFQAVFANCGGGVTYAITEDEFNGRYCQAGCNLQCFSPSITPYHKFMDNIKEDMRAIGMIQYLKEKHPEAQFAGLFPLHACTNHSCLNNSEVCDLDHNGRPGIQMVARRHIKEGEEIFITYIDTSLPKMLRRAWLYRSFNFWCQCHRCLFEGELSNECLNCHKKALNDKKFAACGKCKKAWYCSVTCQKDSWKKGHKIVCLTTHSEVTYPDNYIP